MAIADAQRPPAPVSWPTTTAHAGPEAAALPVSDLVGDFDLADRGGSARVLVGSVEGDQQHGISIAASVPLGILDDGVTEKSDVGFLVRVGQVQFGPLAFADRWDRGPGTTGRPGEDAEEDSRVLTQSVEQGRARFADEPIAVLEHPTFSPARGLRRPLAGGRIAKPAEQSAQHGGVCVQLHLLPAGTIAPAEVVQEPRSPTTDDRRRSSPKAP